MKKRKELLEEPEEGRAMFDYEEEERPFYCEKIGRNCPFESRFRYCWDCADLITPGDVYDPFDDSFVPPASLFEYEED